MAVSAPLLFELGAILLALTVLGSAARRYGLSPIPLYLLTGLFLGTGGVAPVDAAAQFVETGASIGVVLLLLTLGLEFSVREFSESLRRHLPSAGVDLVLNAVPGALAGWLLGLDAVGIMAMAGITYISSSGVVARLLGDLDRLGNRETPAVLSVLVLEDFAMAVYLPVLTVLASGGTAVEALVWTAVALGALGLAFLVSFRWGDYVGRVLGHPEDEQLLLRILGLTLIVAAVAEHLHASAAVGAFLVGLTLTGPTADRARTVLNPLRDLFAAVFFVAIGLTVAPAELLPMLPFALGLAALTAGTKIVAGSYAARREGAGPAGRRRAGTALIARGEFSLVIIGLAGTGVAALSAVATPYVFILAIAGPVLTRFAK